MTTRQQVIPLVVHGGIVALAVLAVTVLGFHGSLDAQAVTAVLGAAIGFAGASAASQGALSTAVNGKSTISTEALGQREVTLRAAMGANPQTSNPPSPHDEAAMLHDVDA